MIRILLSALPEVEFRTLADYPGAPEPEENGATYAENAQIKAVSGAKFTGEWCLADDAGLEVDALGGEPGMYSKRFGGEGLPFHEKTQIILRALQEVPSENRGARFRCVVALARSDGDVAQVLEATCEGKIAFAPSGAGGFGYDPIFWLPDRDCTMADLTPEQKAEVSHRGKVLRAFVEYWNYSNS